eukprot:CAMPEP_0174845024 /NCGR_PEP_ID=MMETSP1114-20130205/11474_1 /TAXON_ID=312471 /ORGANISM="Neobodo designis, Strain CCAP 1951/1" /LENGTH=63 /DNA_ID=CAMNT_0016079271 /DNA_START=28 /DNA_END=215 /DNA_ORIENTATION=+
MPSPPLLPGPQTTRMRGTRPPPGAVASRETKSATAWATDSPASSISCSKVNWYGPSGAISCSS